MVAEVVVLRTDGTVVSEIHQARRYRNRCNALAKIGSDLRKEDPTVAAIWYVETPDHWWTGHYTSEQLHAFMAYERAQARSKK